MKIEKLEKSHQEPIFEDVEKNWKIQKILKGKKYKLPNPYCYYG